MKRLNAVAFIPARAGSKRVPDKNISPIAGHPLLAYSVCAAIDSGIFDAVICATDSELYADVARYYGAEVPFLRKSEISGDKSPDIEWVAWILKELRAAGRVYDAFSILRPTSPFRLPETIQQAWKIFSEDPHADSLRAVEKCKQHPGKAWVVRNQRLLPLLPYVNGTTPWHSCQYADLPEVYAQNASLEIAWTRVVLEQKSITGEVIIPFISQGHEGFDINVPEDLWMAEHLLSSGDGSLPDVLLQPYNFL